jgi:hypothetical protein
MRMWTNNRVAQSITGAIIVTGISAALMLLPALHLGPLSGWLAGDASRSRHANPPQSTARQDASGAATLPAGGAGSSSETATAAPTAAPGGQSGQPVDLHGHIAAVSTAGGYFTFQELGGPLDTISVNGSTRFSGSASSLATLTTGRAAEVTAVRQSAEAWLAVLVNEADNNG